MRRSPLSVMRVPGTIGTPPATANSATAPSRARSAGNGAAAPAARKTSKTRTANGKTTATAGKSTRSRTARTPRKRHITPEQALAQTQALLEAVFAAFTGDWYAAAAWRADLLQVESVTVTSVDEMGADLYHIAECSLTVYERISA